MCCKVPTILIHPQVLLQFQNQKIIYLDHKLTLTSITDGQNITNRLDNSVPRENMQNWLVHCVKQAFLLNEVSSSFPLKMYKGSNLRITPVKFHKINLWIAMIVTVIFNFLAYIFSTYINGKQSYHQNMREEPQLLMVSIATKMMYYSTACVSIITSR